MSEAQISRRLTRSQSLISILSDMLPQRNSRAHRNPFIIEILSITDRHTLIVGFIESTKFLISKEGIQLFLYIFRIRLEIQTHILNRGSDGLHLPHQLHRIINLGNILEKQMHESVCRNLWRNLCPVSQCFFFRRSIGYPFHVGRIGLYIHR